MMPLLFKLTGAQEEARPDGERAGPLKMNVAPRGQRREGRRRSCKSPPPRAVEELKQLLDESGKRNREKLLQRAKWRAMQRRLEVLGFLRGFGLCGLERWAIA